VGSSHIRLALNIHRKSRPCGYATETCDVLLGDWPDQDSVFDLFEPDACTVLDEVAAPQVGRDDQLTLRGNSSFTRHVLHITTKGKAAPMVGRRQ